MAPLASQQISQLHCMAGCNTSSSPGLQLRKGQHDTRRLQIHDV